MKNNNCQEKYKKKRQEINTLLIGHDTVKANNTD